jgi:hypothetical protein
MGKTKPVKLTDADRDALGRAIALYREESSAHREQVDGLLKERDWFSVATLAAYGMQCERLGLRPWQTPPCELGDPDAYELMRDDDHRGLRAAARLVKRLRAAGLSRYEPDPLHALEAAEHVDAAE